MKNILKKALSVLSAAVLSATVLTACGNSKNSNDSNSANNGKQIFRTVDEIKKDGTIRIGVFSDKNPFGYIDNNGDYKGYDIYYAERIGKDLGVKVEYVPLEAANRVEFLTTGKVDITLANFTVTEERAEKVDFTAPYMKVSLGVVSPENTVITSEDQLKGKKLIVVKGTTAETYFTKNHPDVELVKFDEYNEAYSALQDGRGDAFSTDNTEVLAWAKQNSGFKVGIESLGSSDSIAPAVAKGNETLKKWLNDEIVQLGEEQFFHKDYDETLAPVYGTDFDKEQLVVEGGKL
ncbi:MAG: cysteine ABC transporter substrate-binding protein [Oscillospiraceae bacterium]